MGWDCGCIVVVRVVLNIYFTFLFNIIVDMSIPETCCHTVALDILVCFSPSFRRTRNCTKMSDSDNYKIRRVTLQDKDDVLDLSIGIYGGNDYLPLVFDQWCADPKRIMFGIEVDGKLVRLRLSCACESMVIVLGRNGCAGIVRWQSCMERGHENTPQIQRYFVSPMLPTNKELIARTGKKFFYILAHHGHKYAFDVAGVETLRLLTYSGTVSSTQGSLNMGAKLK